MWFKRDAWYQDRIDRLILRARRSEMRAEKLSKLSHELLTENAILRSATAGAIEPAMSVDDLGEPAYHAMSEVRRALAGIGLIRPRQLASGLWSRNEFEVVLTLHDAEALLMRLGVRTIDT